MKKIKVIQYLSLAQWGAIWSAYWRLWPMLLRIKFKQFSKDTSWITKNITLVNSEASNLSSQNMRAVDGQPESGREFELAEQLEIAQQLHESVRLAARLHFLPAHCLPRSLVLSNMLEARNIEARVYIGVSKKENGFASHAWIEVCKQMIAEPEAIERDFTRLQS